MSGVQPFLEHVFNHLNSGRVLCHTAIKENKIIHFKNKQNPFFFFLLG